MIIKISVHDNDFQDVLTRFCKNIVTAQPVMPPEPKDEHAKRTWLENWMHMHDALRSKIGQPRSEVSEDDQKAVLVVIRTSFNNFADYHIRESDKTANYLKKAFECELVDSITDEWHNGEVFYLFPSSYAGQILNF